ncbi:NAD(P)-dependent oxidoreductase [Patescibacteria group bacterium]|nr:NAD(P)-dependent oxidoreductase [Patescibacteria group bacterium]
MAKNLLKAGYLMTGFNRTEKAVRQIKHNGLTIATTPKQVAENSQVIILILPSDKDTKKVIFGHNGMISGLKSGSIIIDMSTSNPEEVKKIANRLKKIDVKYLDAPVSRGRQAAVNGTLSIMVGGHKPLFQKCLPILKAMGDSIFYIGPLGSGLYVKVLNNFLFAINMLAGAQGLTILRKKKVNLEKAIKVISISSGSNAALVESIGHLLNIKHPQIGFYLKHMYKDIKIFNDIARNSKATQSYIAPTLKYYRRFSKNSELRDIMYIYEHLKY